MNDENVGISGDERLNRIERLLERIDDKLDAKVDKAEFIALELRLRDIEMHGTPGLQATARDIALVKRQAATDASAIRDQVDGMQRKIAYATGSLSVVVIVANALFAYISSH